MELHEIHSSELDALLDLYTHMHAADAPMPERHLVELTWCEIQDNPRLKYFGAYLDKQLIAACALSIIPNLTRGCKPYGLIENMVPHRDFRRRGYGKAVLMYALQHAWDQGCYKVMLLTGRKNEATYRFYESAGFNRHAKQGFIAKPDE